nr:aldose epimerase family protein [Haloferula sp. BvORR071]
MDPVLLRSPGLRVALSTWGASIFFVEQRGVDGRWTRITLGDERIEDFQRNRFCFGATCGRYANRISEGRFRLDGRVYQLACNNGPNSLHGGEAPYHAREWAVGEIHEECGETRGVSFHLLSPDGDGGYPGELQVTASYRLSSDGVLSVDYTATSKAATIISLTNHVYWNLSGKDGSNIGGHLLTIPAGRFLPIDDDHLVTGEIASVDGTAFDFRRTALLEDRLASADPQIRDRRGFNHPFLIDRSGLRLAARLEDSESGRWMEMQTDQPAVHLYTGGYLDDPAGGSEAPSWRRYAGVAIEAGGLPDAPNHPEFPVACVLRPGETYRHHTEWWFGGE